eukprot:4261717-Prymnesium_polylepis.1
MRARLGIGRLRRHVARSEYGEHAGPTWNRCPDTMDKAVACNRCRLAVLSPPSPAKRLVMGVCAPGSHA